MSRSHSETSATRRTPPNITKSDVKEAIRLLERSAGIIEKLHGKPKHHNVARQARILANKLENKQLKEELRAEPLSNN